MPSARYFKIGKFCFRLASIFVWLLLAGCQMLGPTAVGVGRGAYNDVIARSGSEQTLGLIVRLRYADPVGLLAVSSVTASLKFNAQAKMRWALDHAKVMQALWCRSLRASAMKIVQRFHIRP